MTHKTTYILYHGNCPDGFGAAWAAWKALGTGATYLPVQHHEPMPELNDGAAVYIVDFSYDAPRLESLAARMRRVVVLDHHKSAQAALAGLPTIEALARDGGKLGVRFEMDKSGAVLAWEHFHPDQPVPQLLRYVQDRDLWRFTLPHSRAITMALSSHPLDFSVWDALDLEALRRDGEPLLRHQDIQVQRLIERAFWRELGGHTIPVVNTPLFPSSVGNRLCEVFPEAPFAACYSDAGPDKRIWQLRSVGDFDVSEVAVRLGGGGHKNAAGFTERLGD